MITREETYKKAFEIKKNALKEKEQRRNMLLAAAYSVEPRLKELEREQSAIGASLAIAALSGADTVADLKKRSQALAAEKKLILEKAEVRDIEYDCPVCKDTGYVSGKICGCVKKIAAEIMRNELSEEMPLKSCRFDNFNLNYYSDRDGKEGNPRRRMTSVLKVCTEYVINFEPRKSRNLLFMGKTGLGKTHLTLAIAGGLIEKGFTPVYGSAENLFTQLEKEKFTGENRGAYDTMTNCDLLIIDDLGAETPTAFSKSAVYNLINSRLLSCRPTIVNTNLSMKEIEARYTARVASRFIGNFDAYKFIGDDIRQQKAIERMNKE